MRQTQSLSEDDLSDDDVVLADSDLNSILNIQFVPDELVSVVTKLRKTVSPPFFFGVILLCLNIDISSAE